MTTARGCTGPEAATARRLAEALARKWGFSDSRGNSGVGGDLRQAGREAEARAARRWRWEYRRCGKTRCWCRTAARGHGPYKYAKRREGRTVRSVYVGR